MASAELAGDEKEIKSLRAELWCPPFPMALEYLWQDYTMLRGRKAPGMHGFNPIEWADFAAYKQLSGRRLAPWEISLLIDLDNLWLTAMSSKPSIPDTVSSVSADDPDGVRLVMKSVAGRRGKRIIANG